MNLSSKFHINWDVICVFKLDTVITVEQPIYEVNNAITFDFKTILIVYMSSFKWNSAVHKLKNIFCLMLICSSRPITWIMLINMNGNFSVTLSILQYITNMIFRGWKKIYFKEYLKVKGKMRYRHGNPLVSANIRTINLMSYAEKLF